MDFFVYFPSINFHGKFEICWFSGGRIEVDMFLFQNLSEILRFDHKHLHNFHFYFGDLFSGKETS